VLWLLGKIFRLNNITGPIKFLLKIIFGISDYTEKEKLIRLALNQAWKGSHAQPSAWLPLGLPRMLLKSLVFAVAGIVAAFILTVFK
jgi:hypothetical protein